MGVVDKLKSVTGDIADGDFKNPRAAARKVASSIKGRFVSADVEGLSREEQEALRDQAMEERRNRNRELNRKARERAVGILRSIGSDIAEAVDQSISQAVNGGQSDTSRPNSPQSDNRRSSGQSGSAHRTANRPNRTSPNSSRRERR